MRILFVLIVVTSAVFTLRTCADVHNMRNGRIVPYAEFVRSYRHEPQEIPRRDENGDGPWIDETGDFEPQETNGATVLAMGEITVCASGVRHTPWCGCLPPHYGSDC
jgi:hypothetical protein